MTGDGLFASAHLSEDAVAAFADGRLSEAAAQRADRHCRHCLECGGAVLEQREAVRWLRTAGAPSLPAGLLDRLTGLPMSTPLPPPFGGLPTALSPDGTAVFRTYQPPAAPGNGAGSAASGNGARGTAEPDNVAPPVAGRARRKGPDVQAQLRRAVLPIGLVASATVALTVGAASATPVPTGHTAGSGPASVNVGQPAVSLDVKTVLASFPHNP